MKLELSTATSIANSREGFNEELVSKCVEVLSAYFETVRNLQNHADTTENATRHFITNWCMHILATASSESCEYHFAQDFMYSNTHGNILIPDDSLLTDAMGTEGFDTIMVGEMASQLPTPYNAFVIKTENIDGLYGIGLLHTNGKPEVDIIPIHNTDDRSFWDDEYLMPVYQKIAYVIMYLVNERFGTIYSESNSNTSEYSKEHNVEFKEEHSKIPSLIIGPRVIYLKTREQLGLVNRAPCAVRGTWCENKFGTRWYRKPHWRRGSGVKRNELPKEVYEHNLRFRNHASD